MNASFMKMIARSAAALGGAALVASLWASSALANGPSQSTGLLVDNFWGQPMNLDIGGTQYDIPADGQQFIQLSPGVYDLSANISGNDAATRTAEIDIPAGEDLQMSYAASGVFFQPEATTQPAASEQTALPAQGATTAQPSAAVANTDITTAAPIDAQPHSVGPNQSLWYRLDLYASSRQSAVVTIPKGAGNGLKLDLYSSSQFDEWYECTPEGIGGADESANLTWASDVDLNKTWYLRVINTTAQSVNFQFTMSGPILIH